MATISGVIRFLHFLTLILIVLGPMRPTASAADELPQIGIFSLPSAQTGELVRYPALLVHLDTERAVFVTALDAIYEVASAKSHEASRLSFGNLEFAYSPKYESAKFGIDLMVDHAVGVGSLVLNNPGSGLAPEAAGQLVLSSDGASQAVVVYRQGQYVTRLVEASPQSILGFCFDVLASAQVSVRDITGAETTSSSCGAFVGFEVLAGSLRNFLFKQSSLLLEQLTLHSTPSLLTETDVIELIATHDLSLPSGAIQRNMTDFDNQRLFAAIGTEDGDDVLTQAMQEFISQLDRDEQLNDPRFQPRSIAGRDARPLEQIRLGNRVVVADPVAGLEWLPWAPADRSEDRYLCERWTDHITLRVVAGWCATWLHEIRYLDRGGWRLPTLPEAVSLIERGAPEGSANRLSRSALFGDAPDCIWTSDFALAETGLGIWAVCYGSRRGGPLASNPSFSQHGAIFVRTNAAN